MLLVYFPPEGKKLVARADRLAPRLYLKQPQHSNLSCTHVLSFFSLSLSCKWIFSFPFSLIRHSLLWHLQFKKKKRAKKNCFFFLKIASQVCSPLVFRVFSRCVFHYWNEVLFLILRLGVFKMNCAILHLQICVVKMQMFCICVVKYLNTYWMNEIFGGGFFFKSFNIFFFIYIHWCRNCRLDRNIHMSFTIKSVFGG